MATIWWSFASRGLASRSITSLQTVYNVLGGLIWGVGVTLLGFFLGELIPDIDRYLIPAILLIIVASVLPGVLEVLRHRRGRSSTPEPE